MGRVVEFSDYKPRTKKEAKIHAKVEKTALLFEREHKKLKKLIGSGAKDFQHNQASVALCRAMLSSVVGMIPIAEKKYYKDPGQSSAFSYTALVNIARELQNDIRNLVDLEQQATHIAHNIVDPNLLLIVQNMISDMYSMRKDFRRKILKKKSRTVMQSMSDDFLRNQGKYINEIKKMIAKQLHDYLVEHQ